MKLYNKQIEARLGHPLTRLELTLDPAIPYGEVNFPTVYYLDDLQLCFSEYRATDTERFILNAVLQGCGTLDQLGRRTRDKIKVLMSNYVKYIEITKQDYNKILMQLNSYKNGKLSTAATDQDQPPPKKLIPPEWVSEAEEADILEMSWTDAGAPGQG